VFSHMIFLFYFFIFQNYIYWFFFKYWTDWEFSFVIFFFKTLLIATVFLRKVFFWWFSLKLYFFILFFDIELVKNYSYNMWEKYCNFSRKLLWIAIVFFSHDFFPVSFMFSFFVIFFFKIIFVDFIFLILSWLEFNFVIKLNYVGKAL